MNWLAALGDMLAWRDKFFRRSGGLTRDRIAELDQKAKFREETRQSKFDPTSSRALAAQAKRQRRCQRNLRLVECGGFR